VVASGGYLSSRGSTELVGLDWIVSGARADAPLADRLEWVEHLAVWVRTRTGDATPATRLKFFLQILDRNPDRKRDVAALMRATFGERPCLSIRSDHHPPNSTPTEAAMKGRIAKNPIFSQSIWRSTAR